MSTSQRNELTAVAGEALVVVGAVVLVGQILRIDRFELLWSLFGIPLGLALFAPMATGGQQPSQLLAAALPQPPAATGTGETESQT